MPARTTLPTALLAVLLLTVSTSANARGRYVGVTVDSYSDGYIQRSALSGRYGIRVTSLGVGLELYGEARAIFDIFNADPEMLPIVSAGGSLRYRTEGSNFTPYITLSPWNSFTFAPSYSVGLDWELGQRWTFKTDGMHYPASPTGELFGVSMGLSKWFK